MATLIANPLIAPVLPAELSYASPGIRSRAASLFSPIPPPVRSRRSHGSSSDESPVPTSDGFTETDLRAGGPQLCESPCETFPRIPHSYRHHASIQGPSSGHLLKQLEDMCEDNNLQYSTLHFCGRRSVYEPHTDPIVTLLVVASRGEAQGNWIDLARRLSHHLWSKGLQGISVEIIDLRFAHRPKIHPCLPTDAIFPVWTQVATEIFHGIDRTGVFTISCFRVGSDYDRLQCPPTILLGVDRKVIRDWKVIREAVISILDRHNLNTVAVAIRKDNKITTDSGPDKVKTGAKVRDCRPDPTPGTSLGPRSLNDSHGTLGGWLEVKNPNSGDWLPFALTCSHCCFPAEGGLSAADVKVIRGWKQHGVRVDDIHKSRLLPIDSPSFRDMKTGVSSIAAVIESLKANAKYREVEDLKAQEEFVLPHLERMWERTCKDITKEQKEHTEMTRLLNSNAHRLGTVFAASGLRQVQSADDFSKLSIRDWALVQPAAPRAAGKNTVTLPPSHHPLGIQQLESFDSNVPGMDQSLFKIGRATGYTEGKYGNLKTCHIATKIVDGKEVDVPTWEHVMIWAGHKVVQDGDSGSLVFDVNGATVGMIFGGTGNHDVGYFTATSDLLADIKHITGAKDVRLRYLE